MSDWLDPAEGKPEPEPETDERPKEESIVLGLYVQGGIPLNMGGALLKAIGSMYPATMWTFNAEDVAKIPHGASMVLRIPLADIHGFAEDEDDDDEVPPPSYDADALLVNAYYLLGDGMGGDWDDNPEYTRAIVELLGDTLGVETMDSRREEIEQRIRDAHGRHK